MYACLFPTVHSRKAARSFKHHQTFNGQNCVWHATETYIFWKKRTNKCKLVRLHKETVSAQSKSPGTIEDIAPLKLLTLLDMAGGGKAFITRLPSF